MKAIAASLRCCRFRAVFTGIAAGLPIRFVSCLKGRQLPDVPRFLRISRLPALLLVASALGHREMSLPCRLHKSKRCCCLTLLRVVALLGAISV